MKTIGEIIKEKNLQLDTDNPVVRGGFSQVPNFILRESKLSAGAKVAYAMFLSYAWHNDSCFPGQDRLSEHLGMSRPRVCQFIGELEKARLITIQRRGLGKTNLYIIHFQVKSEGQSRPEHIGEIIKGKNLQLDSDNPVVRGGFTQVPNFILKDPQLSVGAKVAYAMFLSYAWHNDSCFPGQDRMSEDMGMSRPRVCQFIGELQKARLITIQRRGLGKTNLYIIHFQVKWEGRPGHSDVGGPTSRC